MTTPVNLVDPANSSPSLELAEQLGLGPSGTGPRRRVRWLAVGIAVVLLGGVMLALRSGAGPARYRTEPARRGSLTTVVSATGTLQPTNQVDVGSELSGVVRSVEATYNQRVAKGQVLAQLDTTKLSAQAAQYRAALAAAEAKVAQARATVEEDRLKLERPVHPDHGW